MTTKPQQPKDLKDISCPKCGSKEFDVKYTEIAWARVRVKDNKMENREDGYNLEENVAEYESAVCHECDTVVDISGLEDL